ncbi:MAG: LamG domain-containing protein, partial [Kiritimatiellae bacterium]|nr:LamG domain-containing protein [Kiritimatiellia bacterium]
PDKSEGFDGNPAASSGSVRIAPTQNAKGYLAVYDPNLNVAMRDTAEMTFEGWVNLDGTYTGNGWGIIFAVLPKAAPTASNIDFMLRINYKGGITIYDTLFSKLSGTSALATLPSNTWTHVALVRTRYDSSGTIKSRYELFINGESTGSAEATAKTSPDTPCQVLVGGEPWHDLNGNTSNIRVFPGSVASFRLSKGALTPAEFLCAAGGGVPSPATVAYWPLDNDSGVVDGHVAVGKGGYEMFMGGTGASGQAGMARKKLDVVGVPPANDGSVSVASDPLFADHVGAFLAPVPHASWSVEGYFKNDAGGMVCRMGEEGCGWQLDYEPSQTRFNLVAAPGPQCAKCTSGTFLTTAVMPGDWNHLLLTFDTSADLPVWRLCVNGKTAGSVTNIWSGVGTNYRGMFALGSGEFDLWRVSNGIVDVLDSLYQSPPGMSVIFR